MSLSEESHPEWTLLRLPEELLQEISMACAPEDALRLEKTCRTLRLASDSKHLWMFLLSKLDYEHAPDVLPHVDLGALRTEEIKKLIVRAIRGFENWHSPSGPRVIRERVVRHSNLFYPVMLLAGCDYMLVKSRGALAASMYGVWSIEQEKLVSTYHLDLSTRFPSHHCALLKGGNIVRLALIYTIAERVKMLDHIIVVDLDIARGSSEVLVSYQHTSLPYTIHGHLVLKTIVVGDLVLGWTPISFTLIDVVTGEIARIQKDENLKLLNFDIVRDTAVFILSNATFGTRLICVAKVSRIFAQSRAGEATRLRDICETIVDIPVESTEIPLDFCDSFICNPSRWGSPLPCRILLLQAAVDGDADAPQFKVHRHVQVLTFDQETSTLALISGGTLTSDIPRAYILTRWMQTSFGHSLVCCEDLKSEDRDNRFKRFAILSSVSSGNLVPIVESPHLIDVVYSRIDRYSGTVWYSDFFEEEDTIKLEYFS